MLTQDHTMVRPDVVEETSSPPPVRLDCVDCLISPAGVCRDHGALVIELL
jgi:hypothetical protein